MIKTISQLGELVTDLYKKKSGKIFLADIIKKNGEKRRMICRFGVKKALKGGTLKYNPIDKGIIPVFDMQKLEYRSINLEGLRGLHLCGEVFEVE